MPAHTFWKSKQDEVFTIPNGSNEPTIEEHIKKIGLPHTWGTHVEILAIATLYEISVYVTRQSPSGSYYWEEVKPLKADGVSYPVIPSGTLPSEYQVPNHMELEYMSGVHYDSVVSIATEKVPETFPPKQPQALVDLSNIIVVD